MLWFLYCGFLCCGFLYCGFEHNGDAEDKTQIKLHLENCIGSKATIDNFKILKRIHKDNFHMACYEALFIREHAPNLNKKDEFRNRTLRIKI